MLLALWSSALPSSAAAPKGISFQGIALDWNGSPIQGPLDLRVRVFDDPISSAAAHQLYEEYQLGTPSLDGVFSIVIGSGGSPSGTFDEKLFASADTWLEIAVGDEVLGPRIKLQSVPYALQCAAAAAVADDSITSLAIQSRSITASDIAIATIGSQELATSAVGSDEIIDGSITAADLADGAGSGLDADLIDGQSSTSFLRSDVNDTFDGPALIIGDGSTLRVNGALSIGGADPTDDDEVGFDALGETLAWRNAAGRFEVSDDLAVDGEVSLVTPVNRFLTIPGSSFIADPSGDPWNQSQDDGYAYFFVTASPGGEQMLHAPVNLPAGSTVDQIRCSVYDDVDSDLSITARFKSREAGSLTSDTPMALSMTTSGASASIQHQTGTSPIRHEIVDGVFYWLSVEVKELGPFAPGTKFYGCRLRYQINSLTP
jgi:hypothetical protein